MEYQVKIPTRKALLIGDLQIPQGAEGLVVFAHGSGSSRFSPRNQFVAKELRQAKLATLLIDLLTAEEEKVDQVTGKLRFDIGMLAERVIEVCDWLAEEETTKKLAIGCFGASTGAAAALIAAAERPEKIQAVVSRGGRPDLAATALEHIQAPSLLIVGGDDGVVIDMNREAFDALGGEKELVIIPGATHLFEEPGKLEEVARLAKEWFRKYLS